MIEFNNKRARAVAGLATLIEVLSLIGSSEAERGDHDMAQAIVANEMELRALAEAFHESLSL